MKNRFGGLLRAFFGIKIPFWAFIIICGLCFGFDLLRPDPEKRTRQDRQRG